MLGSSLGKELDFMKVVAMALVARVLVARKQVARELRDEARLLRRGLCRYIRFA